VLGLGKLVGDGWVSVDCRNLVIEISEVYWLEIWSLPKSWDRSNASYRRVFLQLDMNASFRNYSDNRG